MRVSEEMGAELVRQQERKTGVRPIVDNRHPEFDNEGEFQAWLVAQARALGWLVHHETDSRRSAPHFPDTHLVRDRRHVVAELKMDDVRTLPIGQCVWLLAYAATGAEVHLWRPADVPEILRTLA